MNIFKIALENSIDELPDTDIMYDSDDMHHSYLEMESAIKELEFAGDLLDAKIEYESSLSVINLTLENASITPDIARSAVGAYNKLCISTGSTEEELKSNNIAFLTIEQATKYPAATIELATESAKTLIERIKDAIAMVIRKAVTWIKKMAIKFTAWAIGVEKAVNKLQNKIDQNYTDKPVDGAEIEFEFISNRMAAAGYFTVSNFELLLNYSNVHIVDFVKKYGNHVTSGNTIDTFKITPIQGKGDSNTVVLTLCSKKNEIMSVTTNGTGDEAKSTIKFETKDLDKSVFEKFKDNSKPFTKAEMSKLCKVLAGFAKEQKSQIDTLMKLLKEPSLDNDTTGELIKSYKALSTLVMKSSMNMAITNRSAYAMLVSNLKTMEKKSDVKESK